MLTYESREDFLNSRKGKLGASDAPIIMEVSPYSTPYQLWRIKLGLDEPQFMKPHMQEGLDIENDARNYFHSKTGIRVTPKQIKHPDITYMIASLDGIDSTGKNILEIKRSGKEDHEFVKKNNQVPEKYFPQIQHQLCCTNLNRSFYLSFYKDDPVLIEVERDEDYIQTMLGKEADFYKCMIELTSPELIDRDYVTRNDCEWVNLSMEYRDYQQKMNELEKAMENRKKKLIEISNGKNCKGNGITVTHVNRKGNIDYKAIPELQEVDLEKYRKESMQYCKISVGK